VRSWGSHTQYFAADNADRNLVTLLEAVSFLAGAWLRRKD